MSSPTPFFAYLDATQYALVPGVPSYTDIFNQTLGDAGIDADATAVLIAEAANAVSDAQAIGPELDGIIDDFGGALPGLSSGVEDGILNSLDNLIPFHQGILDELFALAGLFGVWGLLDAAINFVIDLLGQAIQFLSGEINSLILQIFS